MEEIKKYIKLSGQAKMIIDKMNDFSLDDFKNWWIKKYMIIGGGHVLQYIEEKYKEELRREVDKHGR